MEDKETIQLLSTLYKQIGSEQFQQAKLFLQCIDLGGHNLESANDLLDLLRIVSSDQKALSVAILKFVLLEIGVTGAEKLMANTDNTQRAQRLLKFPTLLIKVCQRLGKDDFNTFKGCVCEAVLNCNPDSVQSRTNLMKKLLQQLKISPTKVEVLIEWLGVAGRMDLVQEVEEYKQSLNFQSHDSQSTGVIFNNSEEQANPKSVTSQELVMPKQSSNCEGSSTLDLARSFGLFEEDLTKRVLEKHLEVIAHCIPIEWQAFMGVCVGTKDFVGVVSEWYEEAGDEATYSVVIAEFLSKGHRESAQEICGELAKAKYLFCAPIEDSVQSVSISEGAAPATACIESLWDTSHIIELKVFFINPKVLEKPGKIWLCKGQQLTTQMILDWAVKGWNDPTASYPQISPVPACSIQASHIRVEFTISNVSQSYVGQDAQTHQSDWTMQLNLYSMDERDQKSYVLHEFGHALGLEHEHQRSDFWVLLEDLLDYDPRGLGQYSSFMFEKGVNRLQTEYDPDSIMHYWFKIKWLKPKYRDLDSVRAMSEKELPELKKRVVEGVHKRDYDKGGLMAEKPSSLDYKALDQMYKLKKSQQQ